MRIELAKNENFSQVYPTWIIAYCPDTDSFFATNQRFFYWEDNPFGWEDDNEFESENEAINYFKQHLEDFREVRNRISWSLYFRYEDSPMYLENTKEKF